MGARVYRNLGRSDHGEQRDFGETQAQARFQQHFVLARLGCLGADIFAACKRSRDGDAIAGHGTMLHHHHAVGAARQRGSGHDFERLARLNFTRERFTGANFADDEQVPGQIRRPYGKSVAHRPRHRRVIAVRGYRFG